MVGMADPPEKMTDYIAQCKKFQTAWENANKIRNGQSGGSQFRRPNTRPQQTQARVGELASTIPPRMTPEIREECFSKGLCFRCRKPGHRGFNCPTLPDRPQYNRPRSNPAVRATATIEESVDNSVFETED
jgi:hypothetical protein